jgi:hypothetical protein
MRAWRKRNAAANAAYMQRYRAEHAEQIRAAHKAWLAAHPEHNRNSCRDARRKDKRGTRRTKAERQKAERAAARIAKALAREAKLAEFRAARERYESARVRARATTILAPVQLGDE